MFTLRMMFGKGDESFGLLTAGAEEGLQSVQALKRILNDTSRIPNLDDFVTARRKGKASTEQIREFLAKTSVTTIEREEIEALAIVLYKLPKTIEKFAERYILTVAGFPEVKFDIQVRMLDEAAGILVAMFQDLKKNNLLVVTQQNSRLQQIESDADKLMVEQFRGLYSGKYNAIVTIALKDLYEILEKAIDHCRDAGNVVAQVVLHHA